MTWNKDRSTIELMKPKNTFQTRNPDRLIPVVGRTFSGKLGKSSAWRYGLYVETTEKLVVNGLKDGEKVFDEPKAAAVAACMDTLLREGWKEREDKMWEKDGKAKKFPPVGGFDFWKDEEGKQLKDLVPM